MIYSQYLSPSMARYQKIFATVDVEILRSDASSAADNRDSRSSKNKTKQNGNPPRVAVLYMFRVYQCCSIKS